MKGREMPGPIRGKNPCLDCKKPKRHTACHDSCKEHSEWKAEIERVNKCRRDYERKRDIGWRKK